MRGLSARRIASTALCAALLAGVTGPAAMAADFGRERSHAASLAPVPGADALLARVEILSNLGVAIPPLTDLLNAVLKANNGQLSTDEATRLVNAAKLALANVTPKAATPQAKDAMSDALAALQAALDALLTATTSGDPNQVATAVNNVVTDLVRYLAAVLLSCGVPVSELPMVPGMPMPTPTLPMT